MENTLENKSKFFALYWGQKVLYVGGVGLVNIGSGGWSLRHPDFFLELKPLSSISDEDLIECYHLHSAFIAYDYTMDFKPVLEMATHWRTNGGIKDIIRCQYTIDFLRSRGYALPCMGLSVEQLINYGWIKLNED